MKSLARTEITEGFVEAVQHWMGADGGRTLLQLSQEAGVSRRAIAAIRAGSKVSAKTYARLAAVIGYAGDAAPDRGSFPDAQGKRANVVVSHPVGGVIHVTLQPGSELHIRMDANGLSADTRPRQ